MIKGRVVNESQGGKPATGVELILHQVSGDLVKKIKTDPRGQFKFEGIEGDSEEEFHLLLQYEGMEYTSDRILLSEAKDLRISVYDTTHSDEEVEVKAHHLILEVRKGELVVTEILILLNSGKLSYAGAVEIPLPEGAFNPEFIEGIRMMEMNGRFYDDQGIKPGTREIAFRYHLKTPSRKARLSFPLHFSTSLFSLLVSDPRLIVNSDQLSEPEIQKMGDREYLSLVGKDLSEGSIVGVEIVGLSGKWGVIGKVVFGGVLLLVLVGIGLVIQKRNRDQSSPEELLERKGFLVSILSELEERYEKRQLSKRFYEEMKSVHRKRLKKVLEELEQKGNSN